jgi:hypothetical protein
MTQEYIGTKQVTAWEQEKDGQPGYAVKYADGYVSWSPKDVFEQAYIAIGHVSHLPAHQRRVIGERAQLADKLKKLEDFSVSERFAALDPAEQWRLGHQAQIMGEYLSVLDARIAAF